MNNTEEKLILCELTKIMDSPDVENAFYDAAGEADKGHPGVLSHMFLAGYSYAKGLDVKAVMRSLRNE